VLLRAQHPVRRVVVHLAGGPAGDVVRVRADAAAGGVPLAPFRAAELRLEPGPGYRYYSTWVYTLGFESTGAIAAGPVPPGEGRRLGAFVRLELELDPDAPG
jgi:hypothetical protein